MARQRTATVTSKGRKRGTESRWSSLTWKGVDGWAGSRSASRGRTYQRQGRVADLVVTEDGKLLATVTGGDRYVTSAWLAPAKGRSRKIESRCTCPVGFDGCKHAVAVVLAYLEALADEKEVPAARPDDPRWARLSAEATEFNDEFGEELEDEWDDDPDEDTEGEFDDESADAADGTDEMYERPRRGRPVLKSVTRIGSQIARKKDAKRRSRAEWDERIRSHIGQKSQEELAELVCTLVERFPELRAEFQERIALDEGDVNRLVNQTRRNLHAVTAEIGWRNHWKNEGHTPDYARLKHQLERLVEGGHYEAVVKLGGELLRRGVSQIEQSHDEGETAMEISDCLPVVFEALARSSLPAPDKILYAIEADLQDEYDVIGETADSIMGTNWQRADWSVVADRLAPRLKHKPRSKTDDDFTRKYKRDRVSDWLLQALERAGRNDELMTVYEAEARATGSYQRLVEYLLREGRLDDAERWAHEGIQKTPEKYPGIASSLLETLCELARRRNAWDVVAAHAARDFFERPSVQGFRKLIAAAEKAKCGTRVRAGALRFLESGRSPIRVSATRAGRPKVAVDPDWPLPVPEYLAPAPESSATARGARGSPRGAPCSHYDVLLEMAIADKRPDDVLRWYDKMEASQKRSGGVGGGRAYAHVSYADQVAAAVASTHPERAVDIYHRELDAHLKDAHVSAYENCAGYLRKMRPILKSLGRDKEWTRLLADIRQSYRNRPRFMEILDTLEGRTILQSRKSRRGR